MQFVLFKIIIIKLSSDKWKLWTIHVRTTVSVWHLFKLLMRTSNSNASLWHPKIQHSNSLVCLHLSPCSASLHLGHSPATESRPCGSVKHFLSCWFLRVAQDVLRPFLALQTHLHLWPLRTTSPTKRASRTPARTPEWRRRLPAGPLSLSVRGSQELQWAENSLM